jgi:Fanconi anemia group J protein
MEIYLKGEIVILDEGHNIEDACREAASLTVQEKQLSEGINDLQNLSEAIIG